MCTTRFSLGHAWAFRGFCCTVVLLLTAQASAGQVLFVDANATGAGSGTSWTNAYPSLQDALAEAERSGGAISEIWVAAGTYKPDQGISLTAGDRQATFRLLDGVALYGGFAGGETELGQRDVAANVTILSGDLNGDDGPDFANYAENSFHVVTYDDPAASGVVIDGFTISGGNADGPDGLTNQGGGIHIRKGLDKCLPGGPTIRNCIVENNWAAHHGAINDHGLTTVIENCIVRNNFSGHEGGGLQIHSGTPTITNTLFANNRSDGEGGGVWSGADDDPTCIGPSEPTFVDCHFTGNFAVRGGGMFLKQSGGTLTGCTFSENEAEISGGGMYNREGSSPTVTNCTFSENVAKLGGGLINFDGSNPIVTECLFRDNRANSGGGMVNYVESNPILSNCIFEGNQAMLFEGQTPATIGTLGGGMYNAFESSPTITDCEFTGNSTMYAGGGMYNDYLSDALLTNCTFSNNLATGDLSENQGGAISNNFSSPIVNNCVFIGNASAGPGFNGGGAIMSRGVGSPLIINSRFLGNWADGENGSGGAIYDESSISSTIVNCAFSGNYANRGGGLYVQYNNNDTQVINSTFNGNSATSGGGIHSSNNSTPTVTNSIFWGNSDDSGSGESAQIHTTTGAPVVNYTIVQGGWSGAGGAGVLDADPLFVNAAGADGIPGTLDDNLRLMPGSPAITKGTNVAIPSGVTTDLDGNARIVLGIVDLGAYELQCSGEIAIYADVNSDGTVNFLDVSLILDVFRGTPTSIELEDGDIAPCGGDGNVNFGDVSAAVDAFRGMPPCPNLCS